MKKAIFCGTFDPVTLGHIDVIKRASQCFDSLVVFVAPNSEKRTFFLLKHVHIGSKKAVRI